MKAYKQKTPCISRELSLQFVEFMDYDSFNSLWSNFEYEINNTLEHQIWLEISGYEKT